MSCLSIRQMPTRLQSAIVHEAHRRRITKTRVVIDALEKAFGLASGKTRRPSLRQFAGHLSHQEFKHLSRALSGFNRVDEELWK